MRFVARRFQNQEPQTFYLPPRSFITGAGRHSGSFIGAAGVRFRKHAVGADLRKKD